MLRLVEQGRLEFLGIEVAAVVDVDPQAPAMRYAERRGWQTLTHLEDGLSLPGLELIIELTGSDDVLGKVCQRAPPGVRVIDHVLARVFWDLEEVASDLRGELRARTDLQTRIDRDRLHLQHILDALPDLVIVLDQNRNVTRVNQTFERVTGKLRDAALGLPIRDVFEPAVEEDWSEELALLWEDVTTHGRPASLVRVKRTRSGREGHFQISASPIFDEDLEIVRVVISAREITEQVMLKRETEESARSFKQIIDAVHGLITIKDVEGRYQVVNPWTEQVVGIPREQMIGRTAADLFPPDAAAVIHANDQETLRMGGRHVSEEIVTIDGVEHIFVSERLPLTDYKGDMVGVCCVSQDQTHRRQLQQELVQTERLAAIGTLAAGVAHELNNPLSGILAFAQDLMLEAAEDDPAKADYELIVNETLRCRRIVRELLEFARQKTLKRRRVPLTELVARVLPLVERQASFHNIEFEVTLPDDLPPLRADPQQVQQILLNLVINARDAMEASGVIRIAGAATDGGHMVELSVSDSGCGIPEEQLETIFEPFHSTKGEQGHGLGLTAVHSVVERHGGRIEVESRVGAGTTFRVILPAAME